MLEAVFVLILIIFVFLYFYICGFRAAFGPFYFRCSTPPFPVYPENLFYFLFGTGDIPKVVGLVARPSLIESCITPCRAFCSSSHVIPSILQLGCCLSKMLPLGFISMFPCGVLIPLSSSCFSYLFGFLAFDFPVPWVSPLPWRPQIRLYHSATPKA